MADTVPTGPARLAIGCPLDSRGEATVWFGPYKGDTLTLWGHSNRQSCDINVCPLILGIGLGLGLGLDLGVGLRVG